MTTQLEANAIESIRKLAYEAAGKFEPLPITPPPESNGLPATVTVLAKTGAATELKSVKSFLEEYRIAPERRSGTANVTTLQSFIDLVNRHKDDSTVIFAETVYPDLKLTGVIDYHTLDNEPRFGKHRVDYTFPLTEDFKSWIDHNKQVMNQGEFAAFIEEHIADLTLPYDQEAQDFETKFRTKIALPNEMMDMSRGMQVHINGAFKHAVLLQSGEAEIAFTEEHVDASGKKLIVPGLFMIALPAFIDGDDVRLLARLRYRASGGKVTWSYILYKWDFEIRNRVKDDLDTAARETGLPAYEGSPEK